MKHNGFSIPYIKFLSTKSAEDSIKTDDEKINEIIFEEINDLLYGSLKSSEVSKKLQSRISLYLSECKWYNKDAGNPASLFCNV